MIRSPATKDVLELKRLRGLIEERITRLVRQDEALAQEELESVLVEFDDGIRREEAISNDIDELESYREDAERYRWFRDQCDQERRIGILEVSEGVADLIDHHIDKARCGL